MSSGQATFDLKAARARCEKATPGPWIDSDGYIICPGMEIRNCKAHDLIFIMESRSTLPAALDEIERLEAAYLKAQNSNLLRKQAYESLEKIASEQAKRIAELEASLQRERAMAFSKIQRQRHAIARLSEAKRDRGKALVEERAKRLVADRGDCLHRSPIKNQLISRCDKGIICDWCQCPIKDEWRDEAREQLRREGKL
jgi:hypothetical protein